MRTISRWMIVSALVSAAAHGQVTNIVASDNCEDTAMGNYALGSLGGCTSQALYNTAAGAFALYNSTSGYNNTAFGGSALDANLGGSNNTAVGAGSLYNNQASGNSALGIFALEENVDGSNLTAVGAHALEGVSGASGSNNTALGASSLFSYSSGAGNTAVGASALYYDSTGANNTAFGYLALFSNTAGKGNAAQGVNALYSNTTGIRNLGIGSNALYDNSSGSYNIALGFDAGYNVTTGSNNIEIGVPGTSNDNNTIQIGVQGTQNATTIAGIYGTPLTGSAVYVTSTGQLGVLGSSERFKTDITPMPDLAARLALLRPVMFRYKTDPKRMEQYGLIAEEVDQVYPELVIRDDQGRVQGVRYEELAPMLLQGMQTQQRKIDAQDARIQDLEQQVATVNDLKRELAEMHAAIAAVQSQQPLVAQR